MSPFDSKSRPGAASPETEHGGDQAREAESPDREHFAIIIGAGFGGIGAVRTLTDLGIDDYLLLEKNAGPGGVWEANRYPGAACDVPSHLYSFSFAPASHWSRRYGLQPEIAQYLHDCLEQLQPGDRVRYRCEVQSAQWDASKARWELRGSHGQRWLARVLISAVGQLSRPSIPAIPGIDEFGGQCFHSATWPAEVDLRGKRVAVIGSGASAIQFVPQVVPVASQVHLFQRSPPYVLPKPDRPYSAATQRRFARWPVLQRVSRLFQYLWHEVRGLVLLYSPLLLRGYQWYFEWNLARSIADPTLRQRLRPRERLGSKRVLFSNDWYPALSDPKLRVVEQPIERVEKDGVLTTDGQHHQAETLILGTGFAATEFLAPMQITGLDGLSLGEYWRDGAQAYLGMSMPNFPNLFLLYGPNTNLGHNSIVFMLERQLGYMRGALDFLHARPGSSLRVRDAVQDRYQSRLQSRLKRSIWADSKSWYHDQHGRITTNWSGSTLSYAWLTRRFRLDDFHCDQNPDLPLSTLDQS